MFQNLEQLHTVRARRVFLFSATVLLFLQILTFWVLNYKPGHGQDLVQVITNAVLISLIASSITAVILVIILIYLLPVEQKLKLVELLEPSRTKALHLQALDVSDFWFHQGHIGRWVRVTAMPALAKSSVERGVVTTVKMILLNPKNTTLCSHYVDYRRRIAFREESIMSLEDVQAELVASIIISSSYHHGPNSLAVHIFFQDQISLTREDISSIAAFRTQIDPRCPSIVFRNSSLYHETPEFYNISKLNFEFATQCTTEQPLPYCAELEHLTEDNCREFLKRADLLLHDNSTFLKNVLRRVKSDYHPYS